MPPSANPSLRLANFIAATAVGDVPEAMLAKAKRHVLDTLACGIAGACSAEGSKLLDVVMATEPAGHAPVWGTDRAVSARSAALLNGTACHAFELDDTGGCDHSGAVVLPAAIAVLGLAERSVSGNEFLCAVVLGYDIARRVLEACGGYRPHNEAGWHSTATCGTFGAAAAAARILALPPDAIAHALGHAASFSGGLWAFIHDGSQTKRIHAGRAAEGGLLAALLARGGLAGPTHVFEDVWGGFLRTFAPGSALPEALVDGLGEQWRLERVAIKPHASCRGTHAAIDATSELARRHGLRPDMVRAVNVRGPAFLADMCGGRDVSGLAAAQMSLPFALASCLIRGNVDLAAFSDQARASLAVADMMGRIRFEVAPALDSSQEPFVAIETVDGRLLEHRVVDPLGSPTNPVSAAAHAEKVRQLTAMSLDEGAAARLVGSIEAIETMTDVRGLPALLQAAMRPERFN